MEEFDVLRDMAERTGGDIYLGVVGPVRTGKSTFITNFMELLVLPNIEDEHDLERATDELPQSGVGRTVMTTEPKFVPDEAVSITIQDAISLRVRFVDSVGFPVPGAAGYEEEDGGPRMVITPWSEEEMPFEEAAEIGTRKVIEEHSPLGLVVTADGSFGEIGRDSFVEAEERIVETLQGIGKPFVVILNSSRPQAGSTLDLASNMEAKYDVPVLPVDATDLRLEDIEMIMEQALYEFPVKEVNINLPLWVDELPSDYWLREEFEEVMSSALRDIRRLRDVEAAVEKLTRSEFVDNSYLSQMDMATGVATIDLLAEENLFFEVLSEISGYNVEGKEVIVRMTEDLSRAKQHYDRMAEALEQVDEEGFGVVAPRLEDMNFQDPELIKKGNQYGVRLAADAESLHMLKTHIFTEVTPMIGSEEQSRQLVAYLMEKFEDDPQKIWQSDIFGKSLEELLREGIEDKLYQVPESAQEKLRDTLERIINEGSGGLICIII